MTERKMSYGENDYISFREFLCLTMTKYTVSKHRAEKICNWSLDSYVNTQDVYFADTADGKKTRFYNRNDKCVILTKKEEELEKPSNKDICDFCAGGQNTTRHPNTHGCAEFFCQLEEDKNKRMV